MTPETKKITQYIRLKDAHPTMVKVMKLHDLAEELGISFYFENGFCSVSDRDNQNEFELKDIEENHYVFSFPPTTEFKIIYENPEYRAQMNTEWEERKKKDAAILAAKAKAEDERIQREIEEENKRIETAERAKLALLKAKYET